MLLKRPGVDVNSLQGKASCSFVIFLDVSFNTLRCKPANSIKWLYSNLMICFPCLINCTIVLISSLKINLFFLTCKFIKLFRLLFLFIFCATQLW